MDNLNQQVGTRKKGSVFINPLKNELLREIRKGDLISPVNQGMGISYQHVWEMIDSMTKSIPDSFLINLEGKKTPHSSSKFGNDDKKLWENRIILAELKKVVAQINVEISI